MAIETRVIVVHLLRWVLLVRRLDHASISGISKLLISSNHESAESLSELTGISIDFDKRFALSSFLGSCFSPFVLS